MANWTDMIPNFSPYVQTLPVDEYVNVGTYLQGQYNLGLQKAQSYIDNIAGLPIAKEDTKQYVRTKLDDIRQQLGKSMSGDFSDSRLVNQISASTAQIANDPIVQNGVASTSAVQKVFADIEQSRKSGKYGVENEWLITDRVNKWMNDKDVTTVFDGSYVPYKDVNKKILDTIKTLDPESKLLQQPFVTNSKGELLDVDNVPVSQSGRPPAINLAMVEQHYKGKSGERIKNAILASLDQEDYQQLSITGRYRYRNHTPEMLKEEIDNKYKDRNFSAINKIAELKLKQGASGGKEDYNDIIKQYEEYLTTLPKDYSSEITTLSESPDAVKSSLYTDNYIDHISKAFSYEEAWQKYLTNPFFQAAMDEKQFAETQWYHRQQLANERSRLELSWKEFMIKNAGLLGVATGEDTFVAGDLGKVTQATLQSSVDQMQSEHYSQIEDLTKKLLPDEYERWQVAARQAGNGAVTRESFLNNTFDTLKKMYEQGEVKAQGLLGPIKRMVELHNELEDTRQTLKDVVNRKTEEVRQEYQAQGKVFNLTSDQVRSSIPDMVVDPNAPLPAAPYMNFPDRPDKSLVISSDDVFTYALSLHGTSDEKKSAKQNLVNKYGEDYEKSFEWAVFHDKSNAINKAKSLINNEGYKEVRKRVTEELTARSPYGKPKRYDVPNEKAEDRNRGRAGINNIIAEVTKNGGTVDKDILNIVANDENATYSVINMPTSRFIPGKNVIEIKGQTSKTGKLETHYLDISTLGSIGERMAGNLIGGQFNSTQTRLLNKINFAPLDNNSTNRYKYPTSPQDHSGAFLTNSDFPNVSDKTLKGDVIWDIKGEYYLNLYRYRNGKWEFTQAVLDDKSPIPVTSFQLETFISSLTDPQVEEFFKKQ